MMRCSLTLGHDALEPRAFAQVHPSPAVGAFAGVELAGITVSGQDMEVLLAISTAFADAALQLQRLQEQAVAS